MSIITSKEYILCAAIWYTNQPTPTYKPVNIDKGVVLCGHRHASIIHQHVALLRKSAFQMGDYTQGFLTSKNRFVDRKEAYKVAYDANQINGQLTKDLYSEDLY